jgi:hypothetical protein
MTNVYIVTTEADVRDAYRHIEIGQRVYASAANWTHDLNEAKWYPSREEAIDVILSYRYHGLREHFGGNNRNWQVLQLSYEVSRVDITTEERRTILRQNALDRLTAEEREILQL